MGNRDDAEPPLPPISGAAADQGDVTLKAGDGTQFMAYFARASKPTGAGMIVMPDEHALHHFYKELAQRFAEAAIDAGAFQLIGGSERQGGRSDPLKNKHHGNAAPRKKI